MAIEPQSPTLTSKPGAWAELALTLPVFVVYQVGVVFLNVRNATDMVTSRLMEVAHGDRLTYLGLTVSIALVMFAVFAVQGRGQALRGSKIVQIIVEGAAYAIAMSTATSWIVGKLFAGPPATAMSGPFTGLVMSLGAGFYEELAFRAVLFGLGAKVLVWLLGHQQVGLVGSAPPLSLRSILIMIAWALTCAALFSGMHYLGPLGDAFQMKSFVARMVLGLALTLVYAMRGFAAAVWTHALYDVWVLVL
jgi:membrane protease YdiL (CAAX protease family)